MKMKYNWKTKDNVAKFPSRDLMEDIDFDFDRGGTLFTSTKLINVP